jgi:hypothetical protein
MRLEPNREIISILKKINSRNGEMLLMFIVKKRIEIPDNFKLKVVMKQHIGHKIEILHVDVGFWSEKSRVFRIKKGAYYWFIVWITISFTNRLP